MDGLFSAYHSAERTKYFAISTPYIQSDIRFCILKNRNIRFENLPSLTPYTIGVVTGYVNSPAFDKADYLKKDVASSDLTNLRKLLSKRVDLIVIDKYVALYHLKNSPFIGGNIRDVKFLDPPLILMPVHLMLSKAISGYEKKLFDFNTGLKLIQKDGTYNRIIHALGFEE